MMVCFVQGEQGMLCSRVNEAITHLALSQILLTTERGNEAV